MGHVPLSFKTLAHLDLAAEAARAVADNSALPTGDVLDGTGFLPGASEEYLLAVSQLYSPARDEFSSGPSASLPSSNKTSVVAAGSVLPTGWDHARLALYARKLSPARDVAKPGEADAALTIQTALSELTAGEPMRAQSLLAGIRQADPKNPQVHSALGLYWSASTHQDWAIEAFIKAIELDPHNPEYLARLGIAYFEMAKTKNRSGAFLMADDVIQCLQKAIEKNPKDSYEWCFSLANVFEHFGRVEQAAYYYRAAIRLDPTPVQAKAFAAHIRLAQIACAEKRPQDAVKILNEFLTIVPDDYLAELYLADAYLAAGQGDAAIAVYNGMLKTNPTMAYALQARKAECFEKMGRFEDAEQIYLQMAAANQASVQMMTRYKALQLKILPFHKKAVTDAPNDPKLRYRLARTYLKLESWRDAYEEYVILCRLSRKLSAQLYQEIRSKFPALPEWQRLEA